MTNSSILEKDRLNNFDFVLSQQARIQRHFQDVAKHENISPKERHNTNIKDVCADCFFAALLRTQIHMPRHPSSARAKY